MISKELLSEVMGSDVYLKQDAYDGFMEYNNIYELAHKCKEWAINKDFIIETSYEGIVKGFGAYCICRTYYDGDKVYDNYLEVQDYQTEPEAIFKACEWILEQKV